MSLEKFRKQIDLLDHEIMDLLEKRFKVVASLREHKKTITDKEREATILRKTDSESVKEIYQAIFKASKKILRRQK